MNINELLNVAGSRSLRGQSWNVAGKSGEYQVTRNPHTGLVFCGPVSGGWVIDGELPARNNGWVPARPATSDELAAGEMLVTEKWTKHYGSEVGRSAEIILRIPTEGWEEACNPHDHDYEIKEWGVESWGTFKRRHVCAKCGIARSANAESGEV